MQLLPMTLTVAAIGERDVPDWLDLRRLLWPSHDVAAHRNEMRELAANPAFAAFIARDDAGRAIGFAEVYARPFANGCESRPVPFLEGIWVAPPARNSGVGSALLAAVEGWCTRHGFTELGSDALIENTSSHRAHAAWGFAETERVVYFRKALSDTGRS
jgi:aminoglycoside 6'-N-acetyltransferase I